MEKQKGFVAFATVLVLSALFLSLAISVASDAITKSGSVVMRDASYEAQNVAMSCAEYALMELWYSDTYAGNESILVGSEACEIEFVVDNNTERVVEVESVVRNHRYRLRVVAELAGSHISIVAMDPVTTF